MNVFVSLEFDYRKASIPREREHINHGAVRGGERRHLRIQGRRIQALVYRSYLANDQRLQPALRMQPPQRMIARSLGMPYLANALDQAGEVQDIVFAENRFLCAQSKYHFRSAVE